MPPAPQQTTLDFREETSTIKGCGVVHQEQSAACEQHFQVEEFSRRVVCTLAYSYMFQLSL